MTTTHCPDCHARTTVHRHAREGRCVGCRPVRPSPARYRHRDRDDALPLLVHHTQ